MRNHRRHLVARPVMSLAAVLGVGLMACGGDDAATTTVAGNPATPVVADDASATTVADDQATAADAMPDPAFGLVSPQQALDLSQRDDVTVIDVRTPEEFAEGHIDGATMIDFYADTFINEIAALDPNDTYLVYCRSGNRSGQTVEAMQQLGFEQVYDLDGGVVAYGAEGLPLIR